MCYLKYFLNITFFKPNSIGREITVVIALHFSSILHIHVFFQPLIRLALEIFKF